MPLNSTTNTRLNILSTYFFSFPSMIYLSLRKLLTVSMFFSISLHTIQSLKHLQTRFKSLLLTTCSLFIQNKFIQPLNTQHTLRFVHLYLQIYTVSQKVADQDILITLSILEEFSKFFPW